jgi:ubiquinone biosynthesis protein
MDEVHVHRARHHEIVATLRRHSLGFFAGLLGWSGYLPHRRHLAGDAAVDGSAPAFGATSPEHLRLVFEELGPTFMKLGQLLSTRSDVLPPAYIDELSKLQDAAPPVAPTEIRAVILRELGAEPEELFATFDDRPLASASIGQAHAATLADGTPVVVKVRRPGAVAGVLEDLEILQNLAARAARRWSLLHEFDAPGIVEEFAQTLRTELDYLQEGRNAERFAENFAGVDDVVIPRVFWNLTTSRVLTLERMGGMNVLDGALLEASGIDRKRVARRSAEIVLKMIFEDRFFHADLHPGNIFIHDDGTIALIDFGMVGEIEEELHGQLSGVFIALLRTDPALLASTLAEMSVGTATIDREALREDLRVFLARYPLRSLREMPFARMTGDLFSILRANRIRLPHEGALLFKAMLVVESLVFRLDSEFRLGDSLQPYAERLVQERFSASALARRVAQAGADFGQFVLEAPGVLRRLLESTDGNGLQVHLRAAELEPLVGRAERIGNRLVAGMISSALILGVEGIVTSEQKFRRWEGVLLGTGLGLIGTFGGYLAVTAARHRRRPH